MHLLFSLMLVNYPKIYDILYFTGLGPAISEKR